MASSSTGSVSWASVMVAPDSVVPTPPDRSPRGRRPGTPSGGGSPRWGKAVHEPSAKVAKSSGRPGPPGARGVRATANRVSAPPPAAGDPVAALRADSPSAPACVPAPGHSTTAATNAMAPGATAGWRAAGAPGASARADDGGSPRLRRRRARALSNRVMPRTYSGARCGAAPDGSVPQDRRRTIHSRALAGLQRSPDLVSSTDGNETAIPRRPSSVHRRGAIETSEEAAHMAETPDDRTRTARPAQRHRDRATPVVGSSPPPDWPPPPRASASGSWWLRTP